MGCQSRQNYYSLFVGSDVLLLGSDLGFFIRVRFFLLFGRDFFY